MKSSTDGAEGKPLAAHLYEALASSFQECPSQQLHIEAAGEWQRIASRFYRFHVRVNERRHSVLIKVPLVRNEVDKEAGCAASLPIQRPRLVPVTDSESKYKFEYRALSAIQHAFDQIDDARFGVVRVHGFLPEQQALIMDEVHEPQLSRLLRTANRLHSLVNAPDLDQPFYNAGAWLRVYHTLPEQDQATPRLTSRAEFIALTLEFTDFLADALNEQGFFQQIGAEARELAFAMLPDLLPLNLGHGDYAMRNILVGPNSRVTVLDTLAKWRVPIYEDIAYFLSELKLNRLQVLSQDLFFNRKDLARYEQKFLRGYFGQQPIPHQCIQIYQLLILLDRWSFWTARLRSQSGTLRRAQAGLQLRLVNRIYRRNALQLLNIHSGEAGSVYAALKGA